jgi:hypothetical protein
MDHAIRVALTVQETQNQERFNNSFYTRFESSPKPRGENEKEIYSAPKHVPNPSRNRKFSGYKTTTVQESRNAQNKAAVRCYICCSLGHFAKYCPSKEKKREIGKNIPGVRDLL